MSNTWTIVVITAFLLFITVIATGLRLEATELIGPEVDDAPVGGLTFISFAFENAKTFFQILTFQLDFMPAVVNLLLFTPISFGILFIIITIIRGGAR